jgi:hypothetical protein
MNGNDELERIEGEAKECLRCHETATDLLRPTDDDRFICDACAFELTDEVEE